MLETSVPHETSLETSMLETSVHGAKDARAAERLREEHPDERGARNALRVLETSVA